MDWKDYEKEVHKYFAEMYPDATITHDAKTIGRYSKKERQIDVLIEDEVADLPIKIVVEARYFSRKIDVTCVESFISKLDDVDATHGLLVTRKGYSEAAVNRAYHGPHKLELDILNFDDLQTNQDIRAIPYSSKASIVLPAPFGWVIDNTRQSDYPACLYQRGLDFKKAQENLEWMYLNFWHKDEKASSISKLVEIQNEMMEAFYTNLCINEQSSPKRKDGRNTYIRITTADQLPCREITGYIDCDEFIVFFVLFTKEELESKNLRKLKYILKYSMPAIVDFDNTKVIEQLENRCDLIRDPMEKAVAYRQLADWYTEMGSQDKAIEYRRLCWETYPETYENIKPLISGELNLSNTVAAIKYSIDFFSLAPKNPRVMQDLLSVYENPAYAEIFHTIISELKLKYRHDNEALGNISVHYGMYLEAIGNNSAAIEHFKLAKRLFVTIDKSHYVIEQIERRLSEIQ